MLMLLLGEIGLRLVFSWWLVIEVRFKCLILTISICLHLIRFKDKLEGQLSLELLARLGNRIREVKMEEVVREEVIKGCIVFNTEHLTGGEGISKI